MVARIGSGATAYKSWDTLRALLVTSHSRPQLAHVIVGFTCSEARDEARARELKENCAVYLGQLRQQSNPDSRIVFAKLGDYPLLAEYAEALGGITTGDSPRYRAFFWEVDSSNPQWNRQQGPTDRTAPYRGREYLLLWEEGSGCLVKAASEGATIAGRGAWGRPWDGRALPSATPVNCP